MKSKLITILGSCSALAAIAPVSLLCGCGVKISWSKGEVYTPMTPKDITEPFETNDDVTIAYHDDLVKNKKIWCDDKIYQFYLLTEEDPTTYGIQTVSCTIRKVGNIEQFTRPEPHPLTYKIFRVDFDLKMTANITFSAIEEYQFNLDLNNRTLKYRNIPVMAFYDSEGMHIKANEGMMINDKKWSINCPKLIIDSQAKTVTIGSENETYSYDNWDETGSVLAGMMQKTINMKTNYYSNAKVE